MPIEIKEPRNDKTKNLYFRGTYLGVKVDKSSGTPKRSVAGRLLKKLEGEIERGEYPPEKAAVGRKQPVTFMDAALAYLEAGKRRRYVKRLMMHFTETPIVEIDQDALDQAATEMHPNTTAGSRNAAVYTPVLAILHHAGDKRKFTRPKGAKGNVVKTWLPVDDAAGVVAGAAFDGEFQLYLEVLLYTGLRPSEVLRINREDLRLDEGKAWIRRSKKGHESEIQLRAELVEGFRRHLATHDRRRVFRFSQGGHLKHMLVRAKLAFLGLPCPNRRPTGWRQPRNRLTWANFKTFRHTWATWMRIYGGLDTIGLLATDNWRDPRSPARYAHAVARDEWSRVDQLPNVGKIRGADVA